MPRKVKDRSLDSREGRARLKARGVPYYRSLDKKLHLGYRRLKGKAGTWWARHYTGDQQYQIEGIGTADDLSAADGIDILDYWQAQARARERMAARAQAAGGDGKTITVGTALERYEADLKARGADPANVSRIRVYLKESLTSRAVASLTSDELNQWRNGLLKVMARSSVNRACNAFRAALNFVANGSKGALSRSAWDFGLKGLPGATETRNVVIPEAHVRRIVTEAPKEGVEFGLFVEVAAVTGSRPSQLGRILVRDLKKDHLNMPTSRKGRGEKKITHRQVPIPSTLATRLRAAAAGKPPDAPLLSKSNGEPWARADHRRMFCRTVERANLDPTIVTIYALRHTNITRQLAAGVPIRVVAVLHDTSTKMIEQTYSVNIDELADQIVRPTLFDMGPKFGIKPDRKLVVL
jgi:integrase